MNKKIKVSEDVLEDLQSARLRLTEHLCAQYGEGQSVKLNVVSQKSYPYSVICLVEAIVSGKGAGRYYIKRLLIRPAGRVSAENQCAREAHLLHDLNVHMPSETVELILVIPDKLIMITAECAGVCFSHMLRWYSLFCHQKKYQQMLENYSAYCGDWLRRFHGVYRMNDRDSGEWMNYLSGEVQWRVRELSFHDPVNEKMYRELGKKLKNDLRCMDISRHCSMIHKDFAPHNIFLGADRIQVLDFSDARAGHGALDVINYIASLASRCEYRFIHKALIRKMCLSFIKAYGRNPDDDIEMYRLLLVIQSLKRLLVLQMNQGKSPVNRIMNSGKNWHHAYLRTYLHNATCADSLLAGPWPFLNLNQIEFGGG